MTERRVDTGGVSAPRGHLGMVVHRANGATEVVPDAFNEIVAGLEVAWPVVVKPNLKLHFGAIREHGLPNPAMSDEVNAWRLRNMRHLARGVRRAALANLARVPTHFGALFIDVHRANGEHLPLGLASCRVVTNNGVGFIVDAFQNLVELENMKYHGMGTGTNAEDAADSALQTELTTEYNPNSTRATGSTTEGAGANVYRTVGTNTIDSGTPAVTEHGVLSQAATGGGVLLDRSVFAAVNLAAGDGITFTYDLTFTAGS